MTVPELVKSMSKINIARRNFFEMGIYYLVSIFLSVFLWQSVDSLLAGYKCCPHAEWEGTMHLSVLSAASRIHFYDVLMYTNGTVHIGSHSLHSPTHSTVVYNLHVHVHADIPNVDTTVSRPRLSNRSILS